MERAKRATGWMVSCVATLGLAGFCQTASAGQAESSAITLRVQDDVPMRGEVLARGKSEVTRIYLETGVNVVWQSSGPTDFVVMLKSRAMAESMWQSTGLTPNAVGVAPGTIESRGRLAIVFPHRVEEIAQGYRQDEAQILGLAIAHEIGHLLLPYKSHTEDGIMRANWDQRDLKEASYGLLLFTAEQAALIRSRVPDEQRVRRPAPQGARAVSDR